MQIRRSPEVAASLTHAADVQALDRHAADDRGESPHWDDAVDDRGEPPDWDKAQIAKNAVRARRRRSVLVHVVQLGVVAVLLGGWQFLTGEPGERWTLVDEFYVGKPTEAIDVLMRWAGDGTLQTHALATLDTTIRGFVLGSLVGIVLGFLLGISTLANRILTPFVVTLNTIPKLALAPLFIMWFGLGQTSKVAMSALLVFFLTFVNTNAGVKDVDRDLVNVLRVMGASWGTIHRRVTLPSTMVWVTAGLRISVPYAFLGAVVGEMLAPQEGLGMLIQRSSSSFSPPGMFAAIIALVIMAGIINMAVSLAERYLLRWRVAQ